MKRPRRPFIKRALEHGINFFDTADMYSRGPQRRGPRPRAARLRAARQRRDRRDQGVQPDERRPQRSRAVAQAHHGVDRSVAEATADRLRRSLPDPSLGSGDAHRRDARRRSTTSCAVGKARYIGASSMFVVAVRQSALPRRPPRLDAVRVDAESLQPGLSRGRARDAAALPPGRHRRDSVEPAGARLSRRQPHAREPSERRPPANRPTSSPTTCTTRDADFDVAERVARSRAPEA